jgi:hypothetical protein
MVGRLQSRRTGPRMTVVETSYLGYPLVITETRVTVRTKDGRRRIGYASSVKQARLIVRGYRRAERAA